MMVVANAYEEGVNYLREVCREPNGTLLPTMGGELLAHLYTHDRGAVKINE